MTLWPVPEMVGVFSAGASEGGEMSGAEAGGCGVDSVLKNAGGRFSRSRIPSWRGRSMEEGCAGVVRSGDEMQEALREGDGCVEDGGAAAEGLGVEDEGSTGPGRASVSWE